MRRIFTVVICFLLMCGLCVTASAEGIYENAGELYEAWVSGDCVPDYITAVISTDGGTDNLTFGLVEGEAGEKGREEILALVRDDATVTIFYQTYSRNELYRIQDEITDAYFGRDLGLVTAGVSEGANRIVLEVHEDYAENAGTLEMIREVTERYGDAVSFRFTDAVIQAVVGTETTVTGPVLVVTAPQNQVFSQAMTLAVFAMLVCCFSGIVLCRRQFAAVTGKGTVVCTSRSVGKKEIEEILRSSEVEPSAGLKSRVMRSIEASGDLESK